MNIFDKDPGVAQLTRKSNKCTMPSRNYAIITENYPSISEPNGSANGHPKGDKAEGPASHVKNGHSPLHQGEEGAGTTHPAASGMSRGTLVGGLDVSFRVEMDRHDREGRTEGYGFSIPALKKQRKKTVTQGAL